MKSLKDSRNIYLTGMPGAGKSTLGKQLAALLDRSFIDLDDVIEEQMDMSIASIFSDLGESQFRVAEERALESIMNEKNLVVATGGGTPCYFHNMERMKSTGITIFLNPPMATLVSRIKNDPKPRPKLEGDDPLQKILEHTLHERGQFYRMASFIFDQSDLTAEVILGKLEGKSQG